MADLSVASPPAHHRSVDATVHRLPSSLSGRAYPVRFESVWTAALRAAGTLRGWTVATADARTGEIRAVVVSRTWRRTTEMCITISLDEVGLTTVLVDALPRGRIRWGASRLRRRYLLTLDRSVAAAAAG